MNIHNFLILMLSLCTIQATATTAVLCGNPQQVDADEKKAVVHLIFDNYNSRSPSEVQVSSRGKELKIQSVSRTNQRVSIALRGNKGILQLGSKYIDPSNCENYSDATFSMELVTAGKVTSVNDCRCFQD